MASLSLFLVYLGQWHHKGLFETTLLNIIHVVILFSIEITQFVKNVSFSYFVIFRYDPFIVIYALVNYVIYWIFTN